jgi:F-type H+-transporting ATPase subunit alpha
MAVEQQVMVIFAVTNGLLDAIPVNRLKDWEKGFLEFMDKQFPQVPQKVRTEKVLSKESEADLRRGIETFNKQFNPEKPAAAKDAPAKPADAAKKAGASRPAEAKH